MVAAVGPARFYGSSLPRPWFMLGDESDRVDQPVSVLDPLLSWAHDAHWSMGGHSFKRLRLQGKIEGSIKKLRAHQESEERKLKKEKSGLLKKEKKERVTRMKKLKNMEEEEEDLFVETDEEEEDLVLESDEEGTTEEKGKISDLEKETGRFRRLRRRTQAMEEKDDKLIPEDLEEENEDISATVASPSKAAPKPRRRARNLGCEFDKAASVETKGLTGSSSSLSKRKNRSEPETRSTTPTPTWRPHRSSASPTQQRKMTISVVTPRRSSRISPRKVPGSI